MSFLARRVAASEAAFFSQTSKEAIARLREKAAKSSSQPFPSPAATSSDASLTSVQEGNADVLPEILQHRLPSQQQYDGLLPAAFSPTPSSLVSLASAKPPPTRRLREMPASGLSFLPSLPQATFGPRRWVPPEAEVKILPSTANEASFEGMPTIDDAKAKELVEGYAAIFKAFLIATSIVVGGATVSIATVVSKLDIHSLDDIRTKGYERTQPFVEAIRKSFEPWRQWVQNKSRQETTVKSQKNAAGAAFVQALGWKQVAPEVKRE